MASPTKPEVHNISHWRQRATGPAQPRVRSIENLVTFGFVFELCERTDKLTDRQTDTLIAILRNPTVGEVKRQW